MSQSVITSAFEQLKAQQAANGGILTLDEFVFANVPDLNITDPINRAESWPDASQIVYRQAVSKTGMVNANSVVYSVVLGADVGDFDFNWIGLINKSSNKVCMIVHAPLQKKIRTASGQQGNVLTRSFLMEFDGASQQTQIITPADTWQIDFTARLAGADERVRLENIDLYGAAGFFDEGWRVVKNDTGYHVKKGIGYIAGLRVELFTDQDIAISSRPTKIWIDACWRGTLTSAWSVISKITIAPALASYYDKSEQHHVFAIAEISSDGTIKDLRPKGNQTERKLEPTGQVKAMAELQPEAKQILGFDGSRTLSQFPLSDFMRLMLSKESSESIRQYIGLGNEQSMFLPVGVPVPYPLASPPPGFLKLNGAPFDTTKYPKLAEIYPDGVLPDLRGEFIRGWDDGRGIDPGRNLLSRQGDAIREITGTTNNLYNNVGSGLTSGAFTYQNTADDVLSSGSAAGVRRGNYMFRASNVVPVANENRPRNMAFNYIVRAA